MKRWITFILALIIFIIGIYLYLPHFSVDPYQIPAFIMMFMGMVLSFSALYLTLNYESRRKVKTLQNRLSMWSKLSYHINQVGDEVFNELPIGIIAYDDKHEIKWANPHAKTIFDKKINNEEMKSIHKELAEALEDKKEKFIIKVDNEVYEVTNRLTYKFIYLFNITKQEEIKKRYQDQIPALGIIYMDNLDEALASLDVLEQSNLKGEYLAAIADWVNQYGAYLKPYGDERLIVMLYQSQLKKMIEDDFTILDKIRKISSLSNVRVTLSMGITSWDIKYEELGVYAQNAVELAEKRGGDQVVVNIEHQKIAFFGAKSAAKAKSSKVRVRVKAQTIKAHISKASAVYVMGHLQTDLDAFGSMIAFYHMAKASTKKVYMIVDDKELDVTVKKVYEIIKKELPGLTKDCILPTTAIEQMTQDSLLIVVDCQSPKLVMNSEVLNKTSDIIVIDHHRIGEDSFNEAISFVEPYASSTIELAMELFNFYSLEKRIEIDPLEATIMYGGLVIDTNNFSFRTGARTFEVAASLKDLGADETVVKIWLRRDLDRTLEINELLKDVEIVLGKFAFVVTKDIYSDRIMLAQVADAALQISEVDASFMIARLDKETIGVSARSYQNVNVQVLMEELGGGGHLNSAAAQVKNASLSDVYEQLKSYLELEYGEGEKMKIILIEDVKGKGSKGSIIEVASGFGQFLITKKKAMMATEENLAAVNKIKEEAVLSAQRQILLMKKIKEEIDNKKITLGIQIGKDGKMFGSVTTKQIAEKFEKEHSVLIDKKKIEISSEINSMGIYTATVSLHRDIKAQFEIHIIEK